MRAKWVIQTKRADFKAIGERFSIDQVTARLLRNRDVISDDEIQRYLNPSMDQLYNPSLMLHMDQGCEIIWDKIKAGKDIRIIGDYDIDGVTSTYILYQGIKACGGNVSEKIPDRITDGYGLNIRLIEQAISDGIDTIITCDNGISAIEEINFAKEQGMTVVVTDHHNVPYEEDERGQIHYKYTNADAVINPKQADCPYPFKGICGAVVAYKFVWRLLEYSDLTPEEISRLREELLIYAAIGTIGDIMDLKDENRIIVKKGLELLRRTRDESLVALIKACNLEQKNVDAYHIGFVIGPCINASGRLKTAEFALKLLLCKDSQQCEAYAKQLVALNEERKHLTEKFTEQAIEMVENSDLNNDRVLIVFLPECHESIAGIIAGRVRERFVKPTMVVTKSEEGLKGSGRSIEAYPMYDEMTKVAECFTKFGGHALAAGFSLLEENLDLLRQKLNENCTLTPEDMVEKISIDVNMPMDYVTFPLIEEFRTLRPFGKGNPAPLFAQKDVEIISLRQIGRERKFCKFKFRSDAGNFFDGILFENPEVFYSFLQEKYGEKLAKQCMEGKQTGIKIAICYVPEINEYDGRRTMQIQVKNYC